jgi:transposase
MLTWENCVEAQALRTRGWSISAIANHLGHDRKTIRAYLNGERRPGERKPARAEAMEDFLDYCRQRLADDPHLWSTTLFDEVVELGFAGSYQAFTPRSAGTSCGRDVRRARRPGERTGR